MRYISDLHEGDQVSEIYLCKTKSPGTSKFGKSYYSLTLQDKTGMIDGKVWELTNAIGHFEAMDYILVRGQVTSYQGSNQLNIQQIRKAQEGEFDMADYMPSTKKDIDGMFKELLAMISKTKNQYLKQLAEKIFIEDKNFARGAYTKDEVRQIAEEIEEMNRPQKQCIFGIHCLKHYVLSNFFWIKITVILRSSIDRKALLFHRHIAFVACITYGKLFFRTVISFCKVFYWNLVEFLLYNGCVWNL